MLKWVFERVTGGGDAVETPIGILPAADAIDTQGLDLDPSALEELLKVDTDEWRQEIPSIEEHYAGLGERLPSELREELRALERRLSS